MITGLASILPGSIKTHSNTGRQKGSMVLRSVWPSGSYLLFWEIIFLGYNNNKVNLKNAWNRFTLAILFPLSSVDLQTNTYGVRDLENFKNLSPEFFFKKFKIKKRRNIEKRMFETVVHNIFLK